MSPLPLGIIASAGATGAIPTLVESSGIGTTTTVVDPVVLTFQTPLQQGDIVILVATDDDETMLAPAGYTLGFNDVLNSTRTLFAYKVMGAAPDTSVSIANNKEDRRAVAYMVWRGINPVTPVAQISPRATAALGLPDPPAITTTDANHLVLALGFLDDDTSALELVPPANFTMTVTSQSNLNGSTVMAAHSLSTSAGQGIDPSAFTTTGQAYDSWVAATVELNSAS